MRAPIQLDLHLPNFNFPGVGPEEVFDKLVDIATTAERAGFSAVTVMDHYHQIAAVGPPQNWMFEGNTMLAGIAARTQTIALGLLVGGVMYRNPAQHAKITTTLDIVSCGRAFHGIGAAWFQGEHDAYGFSFPPLKERFERLEDHLRIARAMFTQEDATVACEHHPVSGAYNNPKPVRGDIPIVIGGSGERKTLRMVAQYGDGCNFFGDSARAAHLLGVLQDHCDRLGRDPGEITKTSMAVIAIAETEDAVKAKLDAMRSAGVPAERIAGATAGTPEQVLERAHAYREVGIEGLTISMPDVHDLEAVALAGETLAPVFNPPRNQASDLPGGRSR
jgi:F420-dependent oxidoreductase-like protein